MGYVWSSSHEDHRLRITASVSRSRRPARHGAPRRPPGATRAIGALAGLSLSTFTYVCTETLPIGLLLPISADLRVSTSAAGLLVTGYGLAVVVASVPLTLLTRRVPRRRLMPALLLVFAAANSVS